MSITGRKYPLWATGFLFILLAVAVFKDLIANECPLHCKVAGNHFFPAFRTLFTKHEAVQWPAELQPIAQNDQWQAAEYEWVVFAPIPFSPGKRHKIMTDLPPGAVEDFGIRRFTHWLGTDTGGHDVTAGLVGGARVALQSGVAVLGVAGLIGLFLGGMAGFWGDDRLKVRRGRCWANLIALPIALFFAIVPRFYFLTHVGGYVEWMKSFAIFASIMLAFDFFGARLSKYAFFSQKITIPADLWVMRLAEIFSSIPILVIVIAVAALLPMANPSLTTILVIIGFFSWMSIATFFRNELLRVREMDFITAARALGFPESRIFLQHALPNAIRQSLIIIAFGVAGAIMVEASLAFLGISSAAPGSTWGNLLNQTRNHQRDWWLGVFPGLAIAMTIFTLNFLADKASERR